MEETNTKYDEMLKFLSQIPNVAFHKDFLTIVIMYEKNKKYTHPSINGIESYTEYINVIDTITNIYEKYKDYDFTNPQ